MSRLSFGLVGGGGISHSHIAGASHGGAATLACGCFSRDSEKNHSFAKRYGVEERRVYPDYVTMARIEATREDKPDFIVVCTPHISHYEVCRAFLMEGFPVVCDKPLAVSGEQAEELVRLAESRHVPTCVTFTFAGNPMLHLMRELYAEGKIGKAYYVNLTYYLGRRLADIMDGNKEVWRFSVSKAGRAGALSDIGSHIEYLARFVLGEDIGKALARLVYRPGGIELDSAGCVLFETVEGIQGQLNFAQLACGYNNEVSVQVLGDAGTLHWHFAEHDRVVLEQLDGRSIIFRDPGIDRDSVRRYDHLNPMLLNKAASGFAVIYSDFMEALKLRENLDDKHARFPTFLDGLKGVLLTDAAVDSQLSGNTWVEVRRRENEN